MLINLRKKLIGMLGAKSGTSITVGSYISTTDEQGISITLSDGWGKMSIARLSPAGARRIAASLETWATAAEQNNTVGQWQAIIRYAVKDGTGEVTETATQTS